MKKIKQNKQVGYIVSMGRYLSPRPYSNIDCNVCVRNVSVSIILIFQRRSSVIVVGFVGFVQNVAQVRLTAMDVTAKKYSNFQYGVRPPYWILKFWVLVT